MIINFGSINTDHVYQVDRMPVAGETMSALGYEKHLGGKGINQSVAVVRAQGHLRHVGCVNENDRWIREQIARNDVADDFIAQVEGPSGHAVIFVDATGENQIVICGAANLCFTEKMLSTALAGFQDNGDHWVLFQNEINLTTEIARSAKAQGFKIAYSAAPFSAQMTLPLLALVDLLVVNEAEAEELAVACGTTPKKIPVPMLVITKGADGTDFWTHDTHIFQPAFAVTPVDTTGAGDTFLGSFMARLDAGCDVAKALAYASAASALQVTKPGAASAIPAYDDVIEFMENSHS